MIETDRLDPRGRVQAIRELTCVEIVPTPSSTEYRFPVAEEVVCRTQARLIVQRARRETAWWYGLVLAMPQEAAEGRRGNTRRTTARVVGIDIEDRKSKRELVYLRLEVSE